MRRENVAPIPTRDRLERLARRGIGLGSLDRPRPVEKRREGALAAGGRAQPRDVLVVRLGISVSVGGLGDEPVMGMMLL
jgi:hypothetical protein